jgi:hypothetical protein
MFPEAPTATKIPKLEEEEEEEEEEPLSVINPLEVSY